MNEFVAWLQEVFARFGPVSARRMFGGYGIYHDGLMFGLVSDGTLYLKADATNVGDFTQRGLGAFEYTRQGKTAKIAYYLAPDEILDDPDQAAAWARRSFEAALRARAGKRRSTVRAPELETAALGRYLAALTGIRRERGEALHELVGRLFPEATVSLRYRMPTYDLRGNFLAWGSKKSWLSLHTCSAARIAAFRARHPGIPAGVGCLNFRDRDPFPLEDIAVVVRNALSPGPAILECERRT